MRLTMSPWSTSSIASGCGAVRIRAMFRPSKILAKLRSGKVARICSTGSPLIYWPHLAANFGYDGVWVDAEHRAWDALEAREMILRHHLAEIDCIFRPATSERAGLSRMLEDGAAGLMIPLVNTPERARHLVEATKFPPIGERGMDGSGLDGTFWLGRTPEYPQEANRETLLILQIETPLALENVEAIAVVDGVDVLFIGPGDLSLRLGCQPSFDEPKYRAAVARVAEVCRNARKPWGLPVGAIEDARTAVGMGAQVLNFGGEFQAVWKELEACSKKLDELLGDD